MAKKLFLTITLLLLMSPRLFSQTAKPDFAFPQKVEKSAEADLRKALKADNGPLAVNSLVRLALAKTAVAADSLAPAIGRVAEAEALISDPAAKAILKTLEATLYRNAYTANAYKYNRRPTLGGEPVGDYTLWSRDQFLKKVETLTNEALAGREALLGVPLADYAAALTYGKSATRFYPTLYDFAASEAIANLRPFDNGESVLNVALLDRPLDAALYPALPNSPLNSILNTYRSWAAAHPSDEAILSMTRIDMLEYIGSHLFGEDTQTPLDNKLLSLYRENRGSEYAGSYLLAAEVPAYGTNESRGYYADLKAFIDEHPGYYNINAAKNRLKEIEQKSIRLSYPGVCAPGHPFEIVVSGTNLNKVTLKFYDVTKAMAGKEDDNYMNYRLLGTPVDTAVVKLEGEVPFRGVVTARHTFNKEGRYVIIASYSGMKLENNVRVTRCTNLSGAAVATAGRRGIVAVDVVSGKPQSGVEAWFRPWSRRSGYTRQPGTTNDLGLLDITTNDYGSVLLRRGKDRFSPGFVLDSFSESGDSQRYTGALNTSLRLYRPGDTAAFSVVVFERDKAGNKRPASKLPLTAILRDANYQECGKETLTTDDWGRVEGSFDLPAEGLTGTFSIMVTSGDEHITNGSFTVSDYKLPTFSVKVTSVTPPADLSRPAVIKGTATTFAGFPVADAKVKTDLKVREGVWFWSRTSPVFHSVEAATSPDGTFTIEVPAEVIQSSPAPDGLFLCDIAVTSADGETETADTSFSKGKAYAISTSIPRQINLDKAVSAKVELLDALGEPHPDSLRYTVSAADTASAFKPVTGVTPTGSIADVLKQLPVGQYKLAFATVNPETAAPVDGLEVILYRAESPVCPVDLPLWIPETNVVADGNGEASFLLGSSVANANVLLTLTDTKGRIMEQRWLTPRQGVHPVSVILPAGEPSLSIMLNCVRDCRSHSGRVTVASAASTKAIKVKIETFRDKVTPGDTEKLTLRVVPENGAEARSALILDMSNKAIDVLQSNPLNFCAFYSYPRVPSFNGFSFDTSWFNHTSSFNRLKTIALDAPAFNTYGRRFGWSNIMVRGARPMAMMKAESAVEEVTADENMVLYDSMVTNEAKMAAPAMAAGATADLGNEMERSDAAATEAGAGDEPEKPAETYRPSEIPLAFFRPMLTTEADGSLTAEYVVPDANTTWLLRALAYNREMLSATTQADIVASKPLMVNANAPRFLRIGDKAGIAATVMNNADSALTVNVTLSLAASGTGETLAKTETAITLDPKASQALTLPVIAPDNAPGVIFRVMGASGNFSDGEQCLIPILPAEQDVVESEMFYIAPGQASFTLSLPKAGKGSQVMLNFTENPAWEVVSALPGLREGQINSSNEAAAALLSAAVADGLMRDNPEIARTLRRWADNPGDSALVSKLDKDSRLKQMLLSSTPWVQAALSDTERMQRLTLLLNSKNTAKVISKAIADLRKTAAPDGGWYWTSQYPHVSEWATYNIIGMLGDLKRLGWLPDDKDLDRMIADACAYMDREAARDFAKYPKSDYSRYVLLRGRFKDVRQSAAAQRVTASQVQKCIGSWKDDNVVEKAIDALILNNNGYKATSRQILSSLREYATTSPEKGMWWAQLNDMWFWSLDKVGLTSIILDAFAETEPDAADVDKIRQWLILQKQNCDWGNTVVTSQVIASILSSGTKWTVNPSGTVIRVADKIVEPANREMAAGSFTAPITGMLEKSADLSIDRQADYPSFGAVVTLREATMSELRPVSCDQLSVGKSLSVFNGSEWIPGDSFYVGDRVRVELTLTVGEDMDYVVIADKRAAGLEPASQLPEPIWAEGLCFYRENRDSQTNIFINHLPKGTYRLAYELFAAQAGEFTSGAAQAQSQYNPRIAAHSAGAKIRIAPRD